MRIKTNHWRIVPSSVRSYSSQLVKEKPLALVRMRDLVDTNLIMARGGATQVRIYDDNGELMSEAVAFCHPKENFCRKTGREFALRYAHYGMPSNYHPPIVDLVEIPEELKKFV